MDQKIDFEEILEPSPDCCIYRIPQYLRKINEEAYTPTLISVGPLHYGRKKLRGMERQKKRYLSKFSQRVVDGEILVKFKTYIENQEQRIRAHYSVTSVLHSPKYVTMILHDAVFIIELFLRTYEMIDDFLLKSPLDIYIRKDLLLLENQLPYFILDELYTIAFSNNLGPLSGLFVNYISGNPGHLPSELQHLMKHFTDLCRYVFVLHKPLMVESDEDGIYDLPCATKLEKSGLKFKGTREKLWLGISLDKTKKYGKWLSWFEVNELQIPAIEIHDGTESLLRNLMAFEMFHYPTETHICHYVALMDKLINTEKDVDLLVKKGIIVNSVAYSDQRNSDQAEYSDQRNSAKAEYRYLRNSAKAKMFNRLASGIVLSNHSCFNDIAKAMKEHYKHPWNQAKATLLIYFSNQWAGTATVSAIFLLILTVIQTICSVMQAV